MASSEAPTGRPWRVLGLCLWGGTEVWKSEEQLGLEPLSLSKIRDGSTLRPLRPQRTAVFEF